MLLQEIHTKIIFENTAASTADATADELNAVMTPRNSGKTKQ